MDQVLPLRRRRTRTRTRRMPLVVEPRSASASPPRHPQRSWSLPTPPPGLDLAILTPNNTASELDPELELDVPELDAPDPENDIRASDLLAAPPMKMHMPMLENAPDAKRKINFTDTNSSDTSTATTSSTTSALTCQHRPAPPRVSQLHVLTARIEHEMEALLMQQEQHAPPTHRSTTRGASDLFRALAHAVLPHHEEKADLQHMKAVTEDAARRRTLAILAQLRSSVQHADTMDQEEMEPDEPDERADPELALALAPQIAARLLAQDSRRHILTLQARWLQKALDLTQTRRLHAGFTRMPLTTFLALFVDPTGSRGVPIAKDAPTLALARFERLVLRQRLLPPPVKRAFDQVCRDALQTDEDAAISNVWTERAPCEVLSTLVDELTDIIASRGGVPFAEHTLPLRAVLRGFVEQMVFGRVAVAATRAVSGQLDTQNALWRARVQRRRRVPASALGLTFTKIRHGHRNSNSTRMRFYRSIRAFEALPHLVPSSMVGSLLEAMRVLHVETQAALSLSATKLSPDVLLPVLVLVLSRCELPWLPSQLYVMEQFVVDGTEASYYLTCVRVAVLFLLSAPIGASPI